MDTLKKKQVALYLTEEENEKISIYSKKIGVTRQQLMSNLINTGLDELKAMEKYGILAIGVGVRDLLYSLKNKGITPGVLKDETIEDS